MDASAGSQAATATGAASRSGELRRERSYDYNLYLKRGITGLFGVPRLRGPGVWLNVGSNFIAGEGRGGDRDRQRYPTRDFRCKEHEHFRTQLLSIGCEND